MSEAVAVTEVYLNLLEKLVATAKVKLQARHEPNIDGGKTGKTDANEESNENDKELKESKDSSGSQTSESNRNAAFDECAAILSPVVSHPDLKLWFLGESDALMPAKKRKTAKKLSFLFTKCVSNILMSVPVNILEKIPDYVNLINFYVNKIEQFLTDGAKSFADGDIHHIFTAVTSFKSSFSWQTLININTLFLKISPGLAENDTFEQYSEFSYCMGELLKTLVTKMQTSYPYKQNLPNEVLLPLLNLVSSTKEQKFDETAAILLNMSPSMTSSFTKEHFDRLIKMKLPTKVSILCTAVKQSYACQKWFEQWINSGSHLKKSKKREDILPVMVSYLQQGKQNEAWWNLSNKTTSMIERMTHFEAQTVVFDGRHDSCIVNCHEIKRMSIIEDACQTLII